MPKLSEKFETVNLLIAAAIFLVVTLYPKFPLIQVPGTYVSVRLEDFILLTVAAYIFFKLLKSPKLFRGRTEVAVFLFLLVGITSVLSGFLVTKTVNPLIALFHWVRRIEYFVPMFFVLATYKFWGKNKGFLINILVVSITFIFLFGMGQKYFNLPVIVTQSSEAAKGIALRYVPGSHLSSTFAGHYDMAAFLVITLPLIVSFYFFSKNKKMRLLLGGTFLMGLWLLSNSLSRISVISYLVAVTATLIIAKKYKEILVVVFVSLLAFGMSSSLLDRYIRIFQVARDGVGDVQIVSSINAQSPIFPERQKTVEMTPTPIPVFEDRSTSIRLNMEWPRAVRAFMKNPLLGTGYSSITLATDNDWLRLLGEVGLLGFFSFLLIFAWPLRKAKILLRKFSKMETADKAFFAGFTGSLIGVFVNAVFIDVFEASKFAIIFWFLFGVYLTVIRKYEKN